MCLLLGYFSWHCSVFSENMTYPFPVLSGYNYVHVCLFTSGKSLLFVSKYLESLWGRLCGTSTICPFPFQLFYFCLILKNGSYMPHILGTIIFSIILGGLSDISHMNERCSCYIHHYFLIWLLNADSHSCLSIHCVWSIFSILYVLVSLC